jgi:hypothetical protein
MRDYAEFSVLFICAFCGNGQELDPHDPAVIADTVKRADAVIVGTFGMEWCWPWFDGWHCSGALHIEESLFGEWHANHAVLFRWREG